MVNSLQKKQLSFFGLVVLVASTLPRHVQHTSPSLDRPAELDYFMYLESKTRKEEMDSRRIRDSQHPVSCSNCHTMLANETIRKWGCQRNETPTFFVHIGKAGGGQVRARFGASALNYGNAKWHTPDRDDRYYPISPEHNGSFCTALVSNMALPLPNTTRKSLQGIYGCSALSPISSAVACPDPRPPENRCLGCQDLNSRHCHTVYVGHNLVGNEMNWLPGGYLADWWKTTPWGEHFKVNWKVLETWNRAWCKQQKLSRPLKARTYDRIYNTCQESIAQRLDEQFERYWSTTMTKGDTPGRPMFNYAPIYASLPIQRVTVVREPFSWLMSKFSWHSSRHKDVACDDIAAATSTSPNVGWAYSYSRSYVLHLCGQDCHIRSDRGLMTLEEMEVQATMNLRQSFSVVGLLQESEVFFDMVSARIGYIDMSLNPNVTGKSHKSTKNRETRRCSTRFADKEFQANMIEKLPMLGVLQRLYEVAVEVNRFQRQELRACSASKLL